MLRHEIDQVMLVRSGGKKKHKTKLELTLQAWVDSALGGDFTTLPQLMRVINKTKLFEEQLIPPFHGVVVEPAEFKRDKKNGTTDGKLYVFRDRVIRWHDARPGAGLNDSDFDIIRMATEEEMKNGRVD